MDDEPYYNPIRGFLVATVASIPLWICIALMINFIMNLLPSVANFIWNLLP